MVAQPSIRPTFLRLVAGLLLTCLLANLLLILVGTFTSAQLFSYTLPESVGFEKQYKIYQMDISRRLSVKLSDQALACCPIWSPDRTQLAFSGGGGQPFVWDGRDGSTRAVGPVSFGGSLADWSPDGRSLIETVIGFNNQGGIYEIYRIDLNTAEVIRVTNFNGAFIYHADWSPDGNFLAFMAGIGVQQFIYRMNPDGTALQRLAVSDENTIAPKVSPDSQRILFASAANGIAGLYVMNADGTDQHQLPWIEITGTSVFPPDWSPDGSRVIYQTIQRTGSVYPTVSMLSAALDGSVPQVLASHTAIGGMPFCWLPDGSLLYEVDGPGSAEIFMLDPDGLNPRSLLQVNLPVYLNLAC